MNDSTRMILIIQRKDHKHKRAVQTILERLCLVADKRNIVCHFDTLPDAATPFMVIAVGGDGTFLDASREAMRFGVPIVGINAGELGFLAEIKMDEIEDELPAIFDGSSEVQERMVLQGLVEIGAKRRTFFSVNEVMIMRHLDGPMMNYEITSKQQKLPDYRCDAIIIATPTGSTGYNLSVNGPILFPTEDSFIINAMAPHALTHRPIVMPGDRDLTILVKGDGGGTLTVDGRQLMTVSPGSKITITRSEQSLLFISGKARTFFDILAEKLHLGKRM